MSAISWPYHFFTSHDASQRRALLDGLGQLVSTLIFPAALGAATYASRLRQLGRDRKASDGRGEAKTSRATIALTGAAEPQGVIALVAAWAAVMLWLVVRDTSDDYLHITRAPAQAAAALLSATTWLSWPPLRTWLPPVLSFHRLTALLVFALLAAHAGLYLNFYVANGLLAKRVRHLDVQLGLGMLALCAAIWLTGARIQALKVSIGVRQARWLHAALTALLGLMLWFHTSHARGHVVRAAIGWGIGQATSAMVRARSK